VIQVKKFGMANECATRLYEAIYVLRFTPVVLIRYGSVEFIFSFRCLCDKIRICFHLEEYVKLCNQWNYIKQEKKSGCRIAIHSKKGGSG